ncbi:hypothetical protein Pint_21379 [Pistacia integerrima]|uniref:Uncharacterized protein n=1 Tax=Pistacia integerrima TaxID=434235 RepID=A0ACC0XCV5_9ROSI|nr:hypothetical protein Pint_21379 [Pistacia integerrima]
MKEVATELEGLIRSWSVEKERRRSSEAWGLHVRQQRTQPWLFEGVERNQGSVVRHGQGSSSRSNSSNRKPLHCSYCDRDHHVRETCWKLNGYPLEHPKHASNRSNQGHTHFKRNHSHQSSLNNVKESPIMQEVPSVTNGLFDLQIQQILSIMQGKGTTHSANPKANAASSGLLQKLLRLHQLIIDRWWQDHITSSPTLLVNGNKNTFLPPVAMPSGEQAPITSIGNLPLNSPVTLKNVLSVPSFKDLTTRMTIGLGEQQDGLYYLVALASEKSKPQTPSTMPLLSLHPGPSCHLHLFMASPIGAFVFL